MTTSSTDERSVESPTDEGSGPTAGERAPRFVDWLAAGLLALFGLATLLGGAALLLWSDPAVIARLVAEGTIRSDVLGPAALVDVVLLTSWWSGAGLVVTGLGSWLVAGWFLVARRRERRTGTRGIGTNAVLGAVVAVALGFLPLSPVLGGLGAGYLQRGDRNAGLRVGALSGLLAALPVAGVLLFVFAGLLAGTTGSAAFAGVAVAAAVVAVALLFVLLFTVALGAIGGLIGVEIADDRGVGGGPEPAVWPDDSDGSAGGN
jgi:hypothetical protein